MANHSARHTLIFSPKTVAKGIRWFIFLTMIGTGFAILWKTPHNIRELFHNFNWLFVILLIPLIIFDFFLGGFRYWIFFDNKILPHISLWNCIRSNWANIFMGAITPFQTGGGPAQFYILWRCGAKISDFVLASLINFIATLIFFQVASITALLFLPSTIFGNNLTPFIHGSFLVVGGIGAIVLFVLIFPRTGIALIRFGFNLIPVRMFKLQNLRDRLLITLTDEIQRFDQNFIQIWQHKKSTLALTVFATLMLFFNKYMIGYVIACALHQLVPFGIFIGLQIINFFLIYFAPTPGASGIAELSSTWLMQKIMSPDILVYFAILWRFFTTFLAAFIGGIILLLEMRPGVKRPFLKSRMD